MEIPTIQELEEIFEKIKQEPDYKEHIKRWDLYIPFSIIHCNAIKHCDKLYLSWYFVFDKDLKKCDEEMLKIVKPDNLARIKKRLLKLWYFSKNNFSAEELKEKTIELSNQWRTCEWCNNDCYILHEHHFPIPKKQGGKEIVKICPNCHYTFHSLENEIL